MVSARQRDTRSRAIRTSTLWASEPPFHTIEPDLAIQGAGRNAQYPVQRFALGEKANKNLAALCRLLAVDVDQVTIRFGREAVEEATKLGGRARQRERLSVADRR